MDTKPTTKTLQAYRQLKTLIERGRLGAGERVTEAKAAKLVGMSRGPVRESLLRLEAEGLLRNRGTRRSRVVAYTEDQEPEDMLRRYELREQIEAGAARLAAKNMTGWEIDRLRHLAQAVDDAWATGDRKARYHATDEFHRFLLTGCGNPLFAEVWDAYRLAPTQPRSPEVEDHIFANLPSEERHPGGSLLPVVEAIAQHDPDRADLLMKSRVRLITEALRKTFWKTAVAHPSEPI